MDGQSKEINSKNISFSKITIPINIPRFLRYLYILIFKSMFIINEINKNNIDAIYVLSGFWEQNLSFIISRITNKPWIVRLRGDDWTVRRFSKYRRLFLPVMKVYDLIETFILNQANYIIALHNFYEEAAISHGVNKQKITIVFHGVSS